MNFRCPGRTFATRACHRMDNSRGRCSPMSKALRLRGTECRHRRFGFGEYHDPLWGDGPRRPVKKNVLSDEICEQLRDLGFIPSNGNEVDDIQPAPYMVWDQPLDRRR